jgi:hypothetical protein
MAAVAERAKSDLKRKMEDGLPHVILIQFRCLSKLSFLDRSLSQMEQRYDIIDGHIWNEDFLELSLILCHRVSEWVSEWVIYWNSQKIPYPSRRKGSFGATVNIRQIETWNTIYRISQWHSGRHFEGLLFGHKSKQSYRIGRLDDRGKERY